MIVISEELLAGAAKAISACLQEARTTKGVKLQFKIDDGNIRRGLLALIATHETSDYAIGVMVENTQFVHIADDGTWHSWPPHPVKAAAVPGFGAPAVIA